MDDHRQLVLRARQRHGLGRVVRQRQARQRADACGQHVIWQGAQLGRGQRLPRCKQGQRAGGLGPEPLQQAEGIGGVDTGIVRQQLARALLRQQVVEEPLHGAPAGPVDHVALGARQGRGQVVAVLPPDGIVGQRPQVALFVQFADVAILQPDLQPPWRRAGLHSAGPCRGAAASATSAGSSRLTPMPSSRRTSKSRPHCTLPLPRSISRRKT